MDLDCKYPKPDEKLLSTEAEELVKILNLQADSTSNL